MHDLFKPFSSMNHIETSSDEVLSKSYKKKKTFSVKRRTSNASDSDYQSIHSPAKKNKKN